MPYPILDPTGTTTTDRPKQPPRARRRQDLRGATVGLLGNTKQNAAPFLHEIGRLLIARHGAKGTVERTKVNFAAPAPEELIKEMAASCDVIITGIGDCGSCSASAVADGIVFEAAGLSRTAGRKRQVAAVRQPWQPSLSDHHDVARRAEVLRPGTDAGVWLQP